MASKVKGGLGRGLGALFADAPDVPIEPVADLSGTSPGKNRGRRPAGPKAPEADDAETVRYVDISDIKPNANQPRKNFDPEKIEELSASILEHGVIQPLVVRPSGVGYEIVAGERRWRAARKAGLKTVPCLVRELTDEENMLVAIIENMQREDLDPIEEAMGLQQMASIYGMTQEEISRSVSKSRPYIANSLRLLKLPDSIKSYVSSGELTPGHARAILAAPGSKQEEIARRIIKDGLTVRAAEKLAAQGGAARRKPLKRVKSREVLSVEEELKNVLGTKVSIVAKGRGGTIEVEYYSDEELNRLIDLLKTARS
ncbi:MAG: ParB/RepB/Spo0J family partition protein [Eubacterium sp.]|nr:ParB/RepB/Spo0J family partition protein [Eubacterium sp.]MBR2560379.1 ParB/RepB/Spo0J family partition protein [Bacillota bacterium]MBR3212465.1 ParB/RepB/Spo0J family partition protein [Bacillota bacterium]